MLPLIEIENLKWGYPSSYKFLFNNFSFKLYEKDFLILRDLVKKYIEDEKLVIYVGGEHTITPVIFREYYKKYNDIYLFVIDAHKDLKEEYYGNRWSHACAMKRVLDYLPFSNLIQAGVRSWAEDEKNNNPVFPYELYKNFDRIKKIIKDKPVYFSIDMDVIDPLYFPAVNTPEPEGITSYEFMEFIKDFISEINVVGIDLVEYNPSAGLPAHNVFFANVVRIIIGKLLQKMEGNNG